jgi:hypothetical protein
MWPGRLPHLLNPLNRMSQAATTHGRYDQRMTIVAGIAAIAASSLLLLAPAVVLAAAQSRRQADRTAAAELERRRRTLSGEEG